MGTQVVGLGSALRNWRNDVHACRLCRDEAVDRTTAPGSSEPARTPERRLLHHNSVPNGQDERCGWAMPMLDKSPDPDYELELLERSCGSGIVVVMEAPNHDDTYKISKGYLTCDTKTDETGKFLFKLLKSIDLSPEDVLLTNTVQCLPARRGERYPVTTRQRQNCRDHLRRLFEIVRPRVVIAFGNESLRALHRFHPIQIDGRVQHDAALKVSQLVGVPIAPWAGTVLLQLFHPGPIVRANAFRKNGSPGTGRSEAQQLSDFRAVQRILDDVGATAELRFAADVAHGPPAQRLRGVKT